MEQILKIQSEQAFQERAIPGAFVNAKLADFIIPGNNGTFDLSKSYININVGLVNAPHAAEPASAVASDTALYNNDIVYNGATTATIVPTSAVIRNCDMFSANKGMVESIRRLSTLRQILWNFENDKGETHDGLDKLGVFQGRRGRGNRTSAMVQIIGSNVNNGAAIGLPIKAQAITRDIRIPLSDMFGVGNALWNSDVFGDTRIHIEVEPNLLEIKRLGGFEDAEPGDTEGQNVNYGVIQDQVDNAVGGTVGVSVPLTTTLEYVNAQLDMPFYVGQAINVVGTAAVGGAFDVNTIIESIRYNEATNANNPPNGSRRVQIVTRDAVYTNAQAAVETVTGIAIKALLSNAAADQIDIIRAEIVLSQLPGVDGPGEIDYRTYSTEEAQGVNQTQYNKQIVVEPNCHNLIIAHCPTGKTAPSQEWESYRMAINNVDVCGNRDVPYSKPIHSDRILRFFNNRSQNVSNISLKAIDVDAIQANDQNQVAFYPILETMPLTQGEKLVNLELTSAGGAKDVVFYKELTKSI